MDSVNDEQPKLTVRLFTCIKCDTKFERTKVAKGNICPPGVKAAALKWYRDNKDKVKRYVLDPKASYPYPDVEKRNRFYKVQCELKNMKKREEWVKYFSDRLDELYQNTELMTWIWDRRDNESKQENTKRGKAIKEWKERNANI
jgi:hypothetical protein